MRAMFKPAQCRAWGYRRFIGARRGAAAVEFALSGVALFAFLMGIVNLGDLGLVIGALQRGVQGAARQAAVTASNNLANGAACPTATSIQSYFNGFAAPPLTPNAAALTYTGGSPWASNDGTFPGSYLVLTATYFWTPVGFTAFGAGFNLKLTGAAFVMGTSATVTC